MDLVVPAFMTSVMLLHVAFSADKIRKFDKANEKLMARSANLKFPGDVNILDEIETHFGSASSQVNYYLFNSHIQNVYKYESGMLLIYEISG